MGALTTPQARGANGALLNGGCSSGSLFHLLDVVGRFPTADIQAGEVVGFGDVQARFQVHLLEDDLEVDDLIEAVHGDLEAIRQDAGQDVADVLSGRDGQIEGLADGLQLLAPGEADRGYL